MPLHYDLDPFCKFHNKVLKNQFFFNKDHDILLNELKEKKEEYTRIIPTGKTFYRARLSENDSYINSSLLCCDSDFEEYNAEDLSAPPLDKIEDGRANTKHVRYLYLSDSEYCAACEVRPSIGADVVVGSGPIQRNIKCYSFDEDDCSDDKLRYLFRYFRKPLINKKDYLVTEAIAQFVQILEFDGLIFRSAQFEYGLNLVLFDPSLCIIEKSRSFRITGITYNLERNRDLDRITPPNGKKDICILDNN